MQLKNALFKVVKGKDKAVFIGLGSSPKFLQKYSGREWEFDSSNGVIGPVKRRAKKK